MKRLSVIVLTLIGVAASIGQLRAQAPANGFNCIGSPVAATLGQCRDGSGGLRGNINPGLSYASVAGFWGQADGGGGDFIDLGPSASYCDTFTVPPSGWGTSPGSKTITFTSPISNVRVGEALSGTGIQSGAEIASVPSGTSVTMTLPATGFGGSSLSVSGDNGGTLILDHISQCWQKTDYRGEPHEWGAVGDGMTDDTGALQNWLGAYGAAPSAFASGAVATNFGPWIATIPANYSVSSTLSCPQNANIRGQANLGGSGGSSPVRIFAASGFSGSPLLALNVNCRLTGIAIDANHQPGVDAIDVDGTDVVIDGHSLIANAGLTASVADDVLCTGPGTPAGAETGELRIENSQIVAATGDNIHLPATCPNVYLTGDLISGAGGDGVYASIADLTIADGDIEQSQQFGIDIDTTNFVSVSANYIDHNGESSAGNYQSIQINDSAHISICGNHIQAGGDGVASGSGNYTSQVYYSAANDNVSLCGNVYAADDLPINIPLTPQYAYDMAALSTLADSGVYENPGNQGVGIFSPQATAILPPVKAPHVASGFISGLAMANAGTQTVYIATGEASDSTASASIVLTQPCLVNLGASNGLNALDSGSVAATQTYYFYVVASPGGGNPSCIASTSANGPTFSAVSAPGFQLATTGATNTGFSTTTLFNVGSIAGASAGNPVTAAISGTGSATSTILSFSNAPPSTTSLSGVTWTPGNTYMLYPGTVPSGVYWGMQIADSSGCLPTDTYITSIYVGIVSQINLSNAISATCSASGGSASLSLGHQIIVGTGGVPGNGTPANENITISAGLYRLVGALYTDSHSNIVLFKQDADTFYLAKSVEDITPSSCPLSGSIPVTCQLSVPCGINAACASGQYVQVEAFGRVVGGSSDQVLLSSLDQGNQIPRSFATGSPGYTSQSASANTGAPFRLYTSIASGSTPGAVRLGANAGGTTSVPAYEVTDGWVFPR